MIDHPVETQLNPASQSLPELQTEMFLGTVQDLSRSKKMAEIISRHSDRGALEYAPLKLVERLETKLDQTLSFGAGNYIHVGRARFELVSKSEAELFRFERKQEQEQLLEVNTDKEVEFKDCVIFGGLSNPKLFDSVIANSGAEAGEILYREFANGEPRITLKTSVEGKKVFLLQTACEPVNDHAAELEYTIDALKRGAAAEINVILPMHFYPRQDGKGGEIAPITAAAFTNKLQQMGVNRIITLDLHSKQAQGFFDGPFDSIAAGPIMVPHLLNKYANEPLMVVGADEGQMKRMDPIIEAFNAEAEREGLDLDLALAILKKYRTTPNEVEKMDFIGDPNKVFDRTVIIWDDMIDTGGTILKAANILRQFQPKKLVVVSSHGIFSFNGIEAFRSASFVNQNDQEQRLIDELVITDTLPLRRGKGDLISVVSVEQLITEAIQKICKGTGEPVVDPKCLL